MKSKIIIICVAVLSAVAVAFALLPHDGVAIEGRIISVTVTEKSEDEQIVIVHLNADEEDIYIRITGKTKVVNTSGKTVPAEYFAKGDFITVYPENAESDERIMQAKKIVFDNTK